MQSLGLEVCGSAATVNDAMKLAIRHRPQIAVVDLDLGEGPTGIDLAHGLRRHDPNVSLVMLTSYGDPKWAGVRKDPPVGAQWVVKSEVNDASVLQVAIEAALADPHAAADETDEGNKSPISDAQMQILRLVAAGHTNAEIAKRRSLTEDAVNKAITRLLRQLDIKVDETSNARVLLTRAYNQITGSVSERRN